MKLLKHAMVTAAVTGLVLGAVHPPSGATGVGDEGCTPGYWKNHTSAWLESPGRPISTSTTVGSVFTGSAYGSTTFLQALSLQGGSGTSGAERILLRAAVAAYLNAAHDSLGYPLQRAGSGGIIALVDAALASGDRATILALATRLDQANDLGCPL